MLQRLFGMFARVTGRSKHLDRSSSPPPGAVLGLAGARRAEPNERLRLGGPQPADYPRIPGSRRRERQAVANVRRMLARDARAGLSAGDPQSRHAARFAAAIMGQRRPEPGRVDRDVFKALVDHEVRRLTGAAARERQL